MMRTRRQCIHVVLVLRLASSVHVFDGSAFCGVPFRWGPDFSYCYLVGIQLDSLRINCPYSAYLFIFFFFFFLRPFL